MTPKRLERLLKAHGWQLLYYQLEGKRMTYAALANQTDRASLARRIGDFHTEGTPQEVYNTFLERIEHGGTA